jgi:hypothetical protein
LGETELVVSDRYCDPLERPAPEEECQEPCPAHCVLGDWSPWTRCRDVSTNTSEYTQIGNGCTPTPFNIATITYKVAVYAPEESVATLPPFGPIEGQKWFDRISSQ